LLDFERWTLDDLLFWAIIDQELVSRRNLRPESDAFIDLGFVFRRNLRPKSEAIIDLGLVLRRNLCPDSEAFIDQELVYRRNLRPESDAIFDLGLALRQSLCPESDYSVFFKVLFLHRFISFSFVEFIALSNLIDNGEVFEPLPGLAILNKNFYFSQRKPYDEQWEGSNHQCNNNLDRHRHDVARRKHAAVPEHARRDNY